MKEVVETTQPIWQIVATADILRAICKAVSAEEALHETAKIICSIPELDLLDSAAGYLETDDHDSFKLAFQFGIDWRELQHAIPKREIDEIFEEYEKQGRRCYRFTVRAEDSRPVAILKLCNAQDKRLGKSQILAIQNLLEELGGILVKKSEDTINSHLAELAGTSPNEMYLIDAHTLKIFQANYAAHTKTGYPPGRILGLSPASLTADLSDEEYRKRIAPLLEGKQQQINFDAQQLRLDGSSYEANVQIQKLVSSGRTALLESVTDISDHKRVLNLLQATFNGFPGGIYVLDANLDLVIANHRLYELLDLPEKRFKAGCNFEDILRFMAERGEFGGDDPEAEVFVRTEHAKLFLDHMFERTRPDGTVLEVRSSPLAGGGSVTTYVDVTVRKRAEVELRRHRDQLEQAVLSRTAELEEKSRQLEEALEQERQVNVLQRQFVSMASHEFRTPLAVIDAAAQRMERRKDKLDVAFIEEKTGQIRKSVSRIVDLMEGILSSGRLEAGKVEIRAHDCSLHNLLTDCVGRRQEIARAHKISLNLDGIPETICADEMALEQVFANLLSNATKYSPNAPQIDVFGTTEGDNVLISVRDRGIGMDAGDLPQLFQRYFRARTSTGIAGTGIGLNVIKQMVELHGGNVSVVSHPGKGSTFTVTLPIKGPPDSLSIEGEDAA